MIKIVYVPDPQDESNDYVPQIRTHIKLSLKINIKYLITHIFHKHLAFKEVPEKLKLVYISWTVEQKSLIIKF